MMTKLYFRHSYIYEETLARLAGEKFDMTVYDETISFTEKYSKYWNDINDKIFDFYKSLGLTLPEFWLAYPVHTRKGLMPFSDPLTFLITDNYEKVTATVIHELCHVFLTTSENSKLSNELWNGVVSKYPKENFNTISHLLVNLLAKAGVEHIYGEKRGSELLAPERNLPGLDRAWEIIDTKPEVLGCAHPIDAIKKL